MEVRFEGGISAPKTSIQAINPLLHNTGKYIDLCGSQMPSNGTIFATRCAPEFGTDSQLNIQEIPFRMDTARDTLEGGILALLLLNLRRPAQLLLKSDSWR